MKYIYCIVLIIVTSCNLLGLNSPEFVQAIESMKDPKSTSRTVKPLLEYLMTKNPSITKETEDVTGNTLLHYARYLQSKQIDKYLIKMGSDVNAKNIVGQTPQEFLTPEEELKIKNAHKARRSEPTLEKPLFSEMNDFERISSVPLEKERLTYAYKIFNLPSSATWDQVQKTWERLSKIVDPELNKHRYNEAAMNFKKLNIAYKILKRRYKRRYDKQEQEEKYYSKTLQEGSRKRTLEEKKESSPKKEKKSPLDIQELSFPTPLPLLPGVEYHPFEDDELLYPEEYFDLMAPEKMPSEQGEDIFEQWMRGDID